MNDIKRELSIDRQICHGCLSVDRNLKCMRQNEDLFFILLNNSTILPHEFKFLNVLLCWECTAVLKKVRKFQNQIQKAQEYFSNHCILLENFETNLNSLSSLGIINKCNYDFTYNNEVKIEWTLPKSEEKYCDVKEEEINVDEIKELSNDDIDIQDDVEVTFSDSEDILSDTKKIPKAKSKKLKGFKPKTGKLDLSNIDVYINKVTFTVNDLEVLWKAKSDLLKRSHKTVRERVKKVLAVKHKDVAKISKSVSCYTCSYCNSQCSGDTFEGHWREHSVVTYKCELCYKHFLYHSDLTAHIRTSHVKKYTCMVCGLSFGWRREYYNHSRELHKWLSCDHCGKHFSSKRSIEKHMRCNHLPAKCDACQLTFEKYEKLRKHQRLRHRPASDARELCYCVECNKQYPHMHAYKQHLRNSAIHSPKKPVRIPCPDCGRVFTRAAYMNNHYRLVHGKDSKHYCQICDKYYINGYALRTHRKYVHEKAEKPRVKICDICGKGFHATRTLVNHRRTHTGERPFRCPHCPAAFAQLSAQKTHMRTQHKYLK